MIQSSIRIGDRVRIQEREWFVHKLQRGTFILWPMRPIEGSFIKHQILVSETELRQGVMLEAAPGGLVVCPAIAAEARA